MTLKSVYNKNIYFNEQKYIFVYSQKVKTIPFQWLPLLQMKM
jgi:hypothetical protein